MTLSLALTMDLNVVSLRDNIYLFSKHTNVLPQLNMCFTIFQRTDPRFLQCGNDKAYSLLGLFESPFFRAVSII